MSRKTLKPEVLDDEDEHENSSESTAIDEAATDVVNSSLEDTRVSDIVHAWANRVLHRSPLSRNTDVLNYFNSKLPDLITALKE